MTDAYSAGAPFAEKVKLPLQGILYFGVYQLLQIRFFFFNLEKKETIITYHI